MSTIASPRESSVNGRRGPLIGTPTSSTRPSFEHPRSADPSPSRASLSLLSSSQPLPKRNRAALREYYNLKAQEQQPAALSSDALETASISSSVHDNSTLSSVPDSPLDAADFDAKNYVKKALQEQTLGDLLKTYNGILGEVRALEAEKKALVYDNYSKLIGATETIGRMREDMGRSGGGGVDLGRGNGVLDGAVRGVFERAEALRGELRKELGEKGEGGEEETRERERRGKVRVVVERVLGTPGRVRELIEEGKEEQAKALWERNLLVLERWKERGVGGSDVQDCIDEGEAALRGDPPGEKSWEKLRIVKS